MADNWESLEGYSKIEEMYGVTVKFIVDKTTKKEEADDEDDEKWLKKESFKGDYEKGFLTFSCEGNDVENSIYFSRIPHVPKQKSSNESMETVNFGTNDKPKYYVAIGNSGITIGRGLDLGGRTANEVRIILDKISKNERCHALNRDLVEWLIEGSEKKKKVALEHLNTLNKLSKKTISRKQQFYLFHEIYPLYIVRAQDKLNEYNIDLKKCPSNIQDILIDMDYVGHMGVSRKVFCPILKEDLKNNSFNGFKKYLSGKYKDSNDLRWKQRLDYI